MRHRWMASPSNDANKPSNLPMTLLTALTYCRMPPLRSLASPLWHLVKCSKARITLVRGAAVPAETVLTDHYAGATAPGLGHTLRVAEANTAEVAALAVPAGLVESAGSAGSAGPAAELDNRHRRAGYRRLQRAAAAAEIRVGAN
jgi:hypothetical protein